LARLGLWVLVTLEDVSRRAFLVMGKLAENEMASLSSVHHLQFMVDKYKSLQSSVMTEQWVGMYKRDGLIGKSSRNTKDSSNSI